VQPREQIEVESSYAHNRIVGIALIGNHEIGYGVPYEREIVIVRGTNGPKERGTCGKEGNILNVWVMFLRCC